jgi:pSer/pThr/pTyr-binding forkhead associated (FHA) protein
MRFDRNGCVNAQIAWPLTCSFDPDVNLNLNVEETWPAGLAIAPTRLVLTWGAHEVEVTERRPSLSVGREETNGIVIKSGMVSRLHARIEYHNAHFSLTDQSGNGTYVADSAGTTCKVKNETYVLLGSGTISFGINPANGQSHLVKYAVRF